jgi:fumarate reductase subunit C
MAEEVNRQDVTRKPYLRPVTLEWITRHPRYVRYMAREFSCLFIGAWTLLMVCGLAHLADGPAAWASFLALLKSPASIVFHVFALAFALYHSYTWFMLTPKALPFAPDAVIAGTHFAGWAVLTGFVFYFAGAF